MKEKLFAKKMKGKLIAKKEWKESLKLDRNQKKERIRKSNKGESKRRCFGVWRIGQQGKRRPCSCWAEEGKKEPPERKNGSPTMHVFRDSNR